jgi:hypothetical protein
MLALLFALGQFDDKVAASGAELDPVAPRVQSAGDGVERERDAAVALIGRQGRGEFDCTTVRGRLLKFLYTCSIDAAFQGVISGKILEGANR